VTKYKSQDVIFSLNAEALWNASIVRVAESGRYEESKNVLFTRKKLIVFSSDHDCGRSALDANGHDESAAQIAGKGLGAAWLVLPRLGSTLAEPLSRAKIEPSRVVPAES
jgi:hypothetical protein